MPRAIWWIFEKRGQPILISFDYSEIAIILVYNSMQFCHVPHFQTKMLCGGGGADTNDILFESPIRELKRGQREPKGALLGWRGLAFEGDIEEQNLLK